MRTKAEHDRERRQAWDAQHRHVPTTGVACDGCGHELLYSDDLIRMSSPPKRQVKCPNCLVVDYIVA